jgi:type I restriction enzyme R subunit
VTREARAKHARIRVYELLEEKQLAFIDFVLDHYVKQGVEELDLSKLAPLIRLKYNNAVADAMSELGDPGRIREIFIGFQKYLYEGRPAA